MAGRKLGVNESMVFGAVAELTLETAAGKTILMPKDDKGFPWT